MNYDRYLSNLWEDHCANENEYEELHEQVCDAIMNKDSLSYGALNKYSLTPFDSNDLGDKVWENSGLMLQAYIKGDDQALLAMIKEACRTEIDSIIDLIGD